MRILGIETSCDETAAAIVLDGRHIESNVVSSQIEIHSRFGGVVPEIAGRAHLVSIDEVVTQALFEANLNMDAIDAVAVTAGPGLIGALLIGVSYAKALAWATDKPLLPVNHLEAHLYSPFLEAESIEFPVITLLVSGGHTVIVLMHSATEYEVLGGTVDDAAGEAYDKVARILGLAYPGGPVIDALAQIGDPTKVKFPQAFKNDGFSFSFSGIKAAVNRYKADNPTALNENIAASFQHAVVSVLVDKTIAAAKEHGAKTVCIGGGVAANSSLRSCLTAACLDHSLACHLPSKHMCTDNAAMVAATAWWRRDIDPLATLSLGANPALRLNGYTIVKGRGARQS